MNEPMPQSVLELQAQGLMERVKHYEDERCSELRAATAVQVRKILAQARTEALANVRNAIVRERARSEQGLRQAQAQAELEARERAQHEVERLLAIMWAELPGALEARWQVPEDRQAWVVAALTQAATLLGGHAWRIEHGSTWTESQGRDLEEMALARGARSVERIVDQATGAGLRIRTQGVCFDATVAGLLARRDEIAAGFLAEYVPPASSGPALA